MDLCMGCGFCVNPFGCGDDGVGLGKVFWVIVLCRCRCVCVCVWVVAVL